MWRASSYCENVSYNGEIMTFGEAIEYGHLLIVKYIMSSKLFLRTYDFEIAIVNQRYTILSYLLNKTNPLQNIILFAIQQNDSQAAIIVSMYYQSLPNPAINYDYILSMAVRINENKIIVYLSNLCK